MAEKEWVLPKVGDVLIFNPKLEVWAKSQSWAHEFVDRKLTVKSIGNYHRHNHGDIYRIGFEEASKKCGVNKTNGEFWGGSNGHILFVPVKQTKKEGTMKKQVKAVKRGAKMGAATNLSRQLLDAVRKGLGDHYPEFLKNEPMKSLEAPLVLLGLSWVADQFELPGGDKIGKAVSLAAEGEVAHLVDNLMNQIDMGVWTKLAGIAALYVGDDDEEDEEDEE